jgi:hypothetical protein
LTLTTGEGPGPFHHTYSLVLRSGAILQGEVNGTIQVHPFFEPKQIAVGLRAGEDRYTCGATLRGIGGDCVIGELSCNDSRVDVVQSRRGATIDYALSGVLPLVEFSADFSLLVPFSAQGRSGLARLQISVTRDPLGISPLGISLRRGLDMEAVLHLSERLAAGDSRSKRTRS